MESRRSGCGTLQRERSCCEWLFLLVEYVLSLRQRAKLIHLCTQVSSTAWSPDGKLLAVATKTKTILLLDPRVPSSLTSTPSHDSVRPVRVAWISPTHLISTGFSKTASREVILYALAADGKISQVAKQTLDVSPAPLFPYADMDTRILLLYSRGERSCHAFEVQPEDRVPFSPLPSFEHSTLQAGFAFLSKARNDVRAVEVLHALRLTPHTVEVVSFSVPRARVSPPFCCSKVAQS